MAKSFAYCFFKYAVDDILIDFRGVNDPAETVSSGSLRGKLEILEFMFGFSRVNDPAETDFDDFSIENLGEYETISETGFACLSGA
jgi:hypothetical protein